MDGIVGLVVLGALFYWAVKAVLENWPYPRTPPVVHGPQEHSYRPVLRWTDKTERYLETVHMCECGVVREDMEPPDAGIVG